MNRIVENTAKGAYKSFGKYNVKRINDLDGYKYFFDDDNSEWLLIRASGTEPVLRTYAESPTREGAFAILKAAEETLLS
jgi:phosphomannomutase